MQRLSEAAVDELVRGEHLAAEILRDKDQADDYAAEQVAEDQLQKTEVAVIRDARRADNGKSAGFGGNDGERNRPPGNVAAGQEIIAQRALRLAEAESKQRDGNQIDNNDGHVESV